MAVKAVDTDLDFGNAGRVRGLLTPLLGGDAATKAYVDAATGAVVESEPAFTWVGGKVTVITFASGNTKTFTYDVNGRLDQIDYLVDTTTYRSEFVYNPDGTLSNIVETVI